MIEWVKEHMDALVVLMMAVQGFVMSRAHSRAVRERLDAEREVRDTWAVLVECAKVLSMRDDFDCRHTHKRIRDLAAKYNAADGIPEAPPVPE